MALNRHRNLSFMQHFVCICTHIHVTQQLQVIYGHSTYQITFLLSRMSISRGRAGCKIHVWWVSYGSKRVSQSLSDRPFVRTYMQLKNYRMYVDILPIKWLLYYWRHSLCGFRVAWEIWLESYSPRHTSWSFSDTVCLYCKLIHVHVHTLLQCFVCNYAQQQNSHTS